MIVRISGEGQFKLPDEDAERLNELDNRAVSAVEQGDETGFKELWSQMLEIVASDGNAAARGRARRVRRDPAAPRHLLPGGPGRIQRRRADPRLIHAEAAPPPLGTRPLGLPGRAGAYLVFVAVPSASVRRRVLCAIWPDAPVEATATTLSWRLLPASRWLPLASFTFSVFEAPGAMS